jgi:hypothetical protein
LFWSLSFHSIFLYLYLMFLLPLSCGAETACNAYPDVVQSEWRGQIGTRPSQQFSFWTIVPFVYIMSCCDSSLKLTCRDRHRAKPYFTPFLVFLIFLSPPICGGYLEKIVSSGHSFSLYILYSIQQRCDLQIHRDVFDTTLKDNLI